MKTLVSDNLRFSIILWLKQAENGNFTGYNGYLGFNDILSRVNNN